MKTENILYSNSIYLYISVLPRETMEGLGGFSFSRQDRLLMIYTILQTLGQKHFHSYKHIPVLGFYLGGEHIILFK